MSEITIKDEISHLSDEVMNIKEMLKGIKDLADLDKDGKLSTDKIKAFGIKIAREYIFLYIAIIIALFGFYKPWEDWSLLWTILGVSLSISFAIFGGYLKNEVSKIMIKRDIIEREKDTTIAALKQALSRMSIEYEIVKSENEKLKNSNTLINS